MKFILSRTDDYKTRPKRWIVGHGLLFWLVSQIAAAGLVIGCTAVYHALGIRPEELTSFNGDPEAAKALGSATFVILTVLLAAPLLEECIFRLGLSFRRRHVALAVAAIPIYLLWQHIETITPPSIAIYAASAAGVFSLIYFLTSGSFWLENKRLYFKTAVWVSAIAFGLVHLIAFSHYSLALIPYMLSIISAPFFAGCAITYWRVNLGFAWGVALHIFNNLPATLLLI